MSSQTVNLPDGRQLGYCLVGEGKPVIYFHGTASSRLETLLLRELADTYNFKIIGIDRPGYGLSTNNSRKNLSFFNDDINFLTNLLGIETFSIVGWSGGGVFALAYLVHFPERINKAVIASAPNLPFDVSTAHNMPLARYIMKIPYVGLLAMKRLRHQLLTANGDVSTFLQSKQGQQMLQGCSKSDLELLSDSSWVTTMFQSMTEAFHQGDSGTKAILDEHQLFMKSWDLPFTRIPDGRLFIWHGAEDKTCRINNAYEISKSAKHAVLEVFAGKGHYVLFNNLDKLGCLLNLC